MKIVYLHQYFNTPQMFGSTRSYEMARRLVRAGHEVHIVTSYRDQSNRIEEKLFHTVESGINVHWIKNRYSNKMSFEERVRSFLRFALYSALEASGLEGDVVLATSTPLTIALPGVYTSRRNKIPMVFEVRDLWPASPIAIGALKNPFLIIAAKWLERFAYKNASRIVTLAPGMKEAVLATGYSEHCVKVIPNGADLEQFDVPPEIGHKLRKSLGWLQQRPLVVYAGTIGEVNGVDYLAHLAAATKEIDANVRFAILGDGKDETRVKRIAKKVGVLNENFFMVGRVSKNQVPMWLSASNMAISLIIDKKELWINAVTNKFFDALAAGRPIANNHGGWQTEIAIKAGAGLAIDSHDFKAAAEELICALRDSSWIARASAAAKKLAQEHFSRDHLASMLEEVLMVAVANHRKRN
ncbi:MAG: glycosyltransferase family 4 protein [Deltaproteobacteria bacterium]|nr:glycosyltransferase family 4 protein [Deltaproteobacteria bacterium]